jgi:ABC-type thiamin/hydroxymethylpyrimidine transport system permease subunit
MEASRPSLTSSIIRAGSLAGLMFGVNLASQLLVPFFGFGATGFVTGLTVPFFLTLASRINRRFGTATIMWVIYCSLAIPTVLMGPPGAYKPLIGLFGGLAYDVVFSISKQKSWSLYISLLAFVTTLVGGFILALQLGLMVHVEGESGTIGGVAQWVLALIAIAFLLEGCFSTYMANVIYKRRFQKRYG